MRSSTTERNHWAELSIGACALLLPPLALGAALYSMLASPDEDAARPTAAVAGAQAVRSELLPETVPTEGRGSVSVIAARQESAGKSAEDAARRASESTPVQVTAAPPTAVNPLSLVDLDGARTGSVGTQQSQAASAEVSTSLLPRALTSSGQVSLQIPLPRISTTQLPAALATPADLPAAEGSPTPSTARKHPRPARRNTQPQEAFSLKNWLQQQLGIRLPNTGG
jgi:hypothetical protein